jgi:putative ABC transport system substrate-binding protein
VPCGNLALMKRRQFIVGLAGAAAWPLSVGAQQPNVATIGILVTGNPNPEAFLQGFRGALRAVGLIEGQNIHLEVRSSEGNDTLLPQKAAELVRLKVDVIVASLTPAVQAARQATSDIPIVMAAAGDPIATGLISSLARPGGNVTGVSGAAVETAGKRLELIRELMPSVRRVAVLANENRSFRRPVRCPAWPERA